MKSRDQMGQGDKTVVSHIVQNAGTYDLGHWRSKVIIVVLPSDQRQVFIEWLRAY